LGKKQEIKLYKKTTGTRLHTEHPQASRISDSHYQAWKSGTTQTKRF